MGWFGTFYQSTIGQKMVMAVTGVVLLGFVVGHMLGNLLVFQGPASLNSYAELLKASGLILWTVRLILLGSLYLHISAAVTLTVRNRQARPEKYDRLETPVSTWSALTLRVGGVVLLAFVVFHLLHLTTGTLHPAFSPTDAYNNVLIGFSIPAVAAFYLVAMAALALHLHHGVWSLFQTLGWNHPHFNPVRRRVATTLAVVVSVGFSAIVLAVAFGMVR